MSLDWFDQLLLAIVSEAAFQATCNSFGISEAAREEGGVRRLYLNWCLSQKVINNAQTILRNVQGTCSERLRRERGADIAQVWMMPIALPDLAIGFEEEL